ncbi:stage V sporulation protein E [Clostridium oryzae]|uniref:Probable peptidoglycan glycosyltransferase FtsW n=1 Tax=Clostridium oryzae TaxID=1450648 RepID=A0A1V4IUZ2_9CLOT|nr:stage V sporulation protein E [Clostridium oryzae]OPJ63237.1 lipid II flippase FtsW [Clostridium oryzae]
MEKARKKMGEADFVMFITIMLLLAVGIIMVYSASSWTAEIKYKDDMYFLKRQGAWAVLGIICMFFAIGYDYHKLRKFSNILMILCIPLLLIVFAMPSVNGARRWINLGFTSFQPSEIVKYVVVLFMAKSMDKRGEEIKKLFSGVGYYLFISLIYAGLILAENNMSIFTVIVMVTMIMLFVAGARCWHLFGIVTPLGLVGAVALIFSKSYRRDRILGFMDPWKNALSEGYQLIQSLLALGSGGIWGVGLGQSRQKAYYLPEAHNDFIFSIIGEELGLIGCAFVIALFMILIWRGIRTALNAKDIFGTLLATGITSIIAVQAIINIAVVSGSMPVTGVPLPFISAGGTSLVINMVATGVLLNISRQRK